MVPVKPILRHKVIASGESFTIDNWSFFSYRCNTGASVVIVNELGDTISDNGTFGFTNTYPAGMAPLTLTAAGGSVTLMYVGSIG